MKIRTRNLFLFLLILIFNSRSFAQNVGIGTENPTATLHIKSSIQSIELLEEDFNRGTINPTYQAGSYDWEISENRPYEGAYSAIGPSNLPAEKTAILEFNLNTPVGKEVFIKFAWKNQESDATLNFSSPGETINLSYRIGWSNYDNSFIATSAISTISITLTSLTTLTDPQVYIDAISIFYYSDPAFRLENGSQMEGAFLESDIDGNATWVDLRSEISQGLDTLSFELNYDMVNHQLGIENGNQVRIQSLSNDNGEFLHLFKDSLWLSQGSSFSIGGITQVGSFFSYDNQGGTMAWGYDLTGNNPTAVYTTRWGYANILNSNYSTSWGIRNELNSPFGTTWGKENLISDSLSTSWGIFNIATGKYSTTWGRKNVASGYNSTAWGSANSALFHNTTAWGTQDTINGINSTGWGLRNKTQNGYSTVWGADNKIYSSYSTGWGSKNIVNGTYGTVWGQENNVSGQYSTIWGIKNTTNSNYTTAWGGENNVSGLYSTGWGFDNNVNGNYSTSWGYQNDINAGVSTAWGYQNHVVSDYGTAWGFYSWANGYGSTAFGYNTQANSYGEIALGGYNYSEVSGNSSTWVATDQAFSVGAGTSVTDRKNAITVLKNGNVGIGDGAHFPQYILDIRSEYAPGLFARIANTQSNAGLIIHSGSIYDAVIKFKQISGSDFDGSVGYNGVLNATYLSHKDNPFALVLNENGVGIKNLYPDYDLQLGNDSAAKPGSSTWTVASDVRFKKDIQPFEDGIEILKKINPVWFTYNGLAGTGEGTYVGTVAQDLEKAAPYMVKEIRNQSNKRSNESYKAVDYHSLNFILVNAVKEQQEQIDELKELVRQQGEIIKAMQQESVKEK